MIRSTNHATLIPPSFAPRAAGGTLVNDVHSRLNPTRVAAVVRPDSLQAVQRVVRDAARAGQAVCIAGGRHAMGGQQFAEGAVMIDCGALDRVLRFDREWGLIEVGAGIQWPALVEFLQTAQAGEREPWGIIQKQTGADRLSLGGALAANVHGRGLRMRPLIDDVEAFVLVDARGEAVRCSRTENAELFRLAIGGYGLFGVVTSVTLRLTRRQLLQRVVEIADVEDLIPSLERRIAEGHLYGDFQFATDPESNDFLRRGVLATYRPVDPRTPVPAGQRSLSADEWWTLLHLAHVDKSRAFDHYARHYLATSGQIYGSDTHQMSTYLDDYHPRLDRQLGAAHPASEVITEVYVPRGELCALLDEVRRDFRAHGTDLIYGTIRLIERDEESFLAWARESYACVIFNLHTEHTAEGQRRSAETFRRLIDMAARRGGSYYLTYHRHATREQLLACYPQFPEFLRRKRRYDPDERFQSEWYRHHSRMFSRDDAATEAK